MRVLKSLLVLAALLWAGLVSAAPRVEAINPPQPTDNRDKIEVTEFFWYGCPHCFHFEPNLVRWMKTQPKDVVLRRVPGAPNPPWIPGAKAFYTLDALGALDRLHEDLFIAIQQQQSVMPTDENAYAVWAGKNGIDPKKFTEVFNSFTVQSKVQRAAQINLGHNIHGVPTLVIDGRYRLVDVSVMSYEEFAKTADDLVAKVRAERGKK